MLRSRLLRTFAVLAMVAGLCAPLAQSVNASPQPSFDTIRIQDSGFIFQYEVSIDWSPLLLTTPDGGAWLFFTAQLNYFDAQGNAQLSNRRIFGSRFSPDTGTWTPARVLPGDSVSFGPTGVVDSQGNVHLVYNVRASLDDADLSTLVYLHSNPDGTFAGPTLVAPSADSGHQLSADLAIDSNDGIHVVFQDQRAVSADARAANAANADIFEADLQADGSWSDPVQVNVRPDENTNASRPQIAIDGNQMVVVWSNYEADQSLDSASTIAGSTRSLDDPNSWTEQQTLVEKGDTQIGGRFLDLASSPLGGTTILYGQRTDTNGALIMRTLPSGSDTWGAPSIIATGNRGAYPKLAYAQDGSMYVVYNWGDGDIVHVGALGFAPGAQQSGGEALLTEGELGAQGIPVIAIDAAGGVWVAYFHQDTQNGTDTAVTAVRTLRGAIISTQIPTPEASPEAGTPTAAEAPAATPSS